VSRPFSVDVGRLLRNPGSRIREQRSGPLPGLKVTGSRVPDDAAVEIDVALDAADDSSIVAIGDVRATWVGECSRCLRPVAGQVTTTVRELFEAPSKPGHRADPDADPDEEIYPLSGDQADLEPLARDAVLLVLPQAPLCAEDCAGLCPVCGADRNEAECGCDTVVRDPRWAALDALREETS
jgi:uncharacterized protein